MFFAALALVSVGLTIFSAAGEVYAPKQPGHFAADHHLETSAGGDIEADTAAPEADGKQALYGGGSVALSGGDLSAAVGSSHTGVPIGGACSPVRNEPASASSWTGKAGRASRRMGSAGSEHVVYKPSSRRQGVQAQHGEELQSLWAGPDSASPAD